MKYVPSLNFRIIFAPLFIWRHEFARSEIQLHPGQIFLGQMSIFFCFSEHGTSCARH